MKKIIVGVLSVIALAGVWWLWREHLGGDERSAGSHEQADGELLTHAWSLGEIRVYSYQLDIRNATGAGAGFGVPNHIVMKADYISKAVAVDERGVLLARQILVDEYSADGVPMDSLVSASSGQIFFCQISPEGKELGRQFPSKIPAAAQTFLSSHPGFQIVLSPVATETWRAEEDYPQFSVIAGYRRDGWSVRKQVVSMGSTVGSPGQVPVEVRSFKGEARFAAHGLVSYAEDSQLVYGDSGNGFSIAIDQHLNVSRLEETDMAGNLLPLLDALNDRSGLFTQASELNGLSRRETTDDNEWKRRMEERRDEELKRMTPAELAAKLRASPFADAENRVNINAVEMLAQWLRLHPREGRWIREDLILRESAGRDAALLAVLALARAGASPEIQDELALVVKADGLDQHVRLQALLAAGDLSQLLQHLGGEQSVQPTIAAALMDVVDLEWETGSADAAGLALVSLGRLGAQDRELEGLLNQWLLEHLPEHDAIDGNIDGLIAGWNAAANLGHTDADLLRLADGYLAKAEDDYLREAALGYLMMEPARRDEAIVAGLNDLSAHMREATLKLMIQRKIANEQIRLEVESLAIRSGESEEVVNLATQVLTEMGGWTTGG